MKKPNNLYILTHEAAVAFDIGTEDGGEPAFHFVPHRGKQGE